MRVRLHWCNDTPGILFRLSHGADGKAPISTLRTGRDPVLPLPDAAGSTGKPCPIAGESGRKRKSGVPLAL